MDVLSSKNIDENFNFERMTTKWFERMDAKREKSNHNDKMDKEGNRDEQHQDDYRGNPSIHEWYLYIKGAQYLLLHVY